MLPLKSSLNWLTRPISAPVACGSTPRRKEVSNSRETGAIIDYGSWTWSQKSRCCLKQSRKIRDFCLKQGRKIRDQGQAWAPQPHLPTQTAVEHLPRAVSSVFLSKHFSLVASHRLIYLAPDSTANFFRTHISDWVRVSIKYRNNPIIEPPQISPPENKLPNSLPNISWLNKPMDC